MSDPDAVESAESDEEPAERTEPETDPAAPAEFSPPPEAELPTAEEPPAVEGPLTVEEPPVAPVPCASDAEGLVVDALERIESKLSESQRLVDRQAEVAAKLHAENQTLRGGELRTAQMALVLSVLRVYDDVNQMAVTTDSPATRKDLEIVADSLADALARNGVDRCPVNPNEAFEARRHKIVAIEPTTNVDADRTVARVVRTGFDWSDGTTVRLSEVAVFKRTQPEEPSGGPPAPDPTGVASTH